MRYYDYYLGLDYAPRRHLTALATLRPIWTDGEPDLHVADLEVTRGASNPSIVTEVERLMTLLEGKVILGVDATGPGEGLAQDLRRIVNPRLRVVEVRFGSGAAVNLKLHTCTMPSNRTHEALYSLLTRGALKFDPAHPSTSLAVEEFDATEMQETASGAVKYECKVGNSHGDVIKALGIAAALFMHPYEATIMRKARLEQVKQSRAENGRPRSTTRRPKPRVIYGGKGLPEPSGQRSITSLMREIKNFRE